LYDREYARDLLNRWPSWSGAWYPGGGGYSSDGSYGSSGSGYSAYDSGYTNPYTTQTAGGSDSNTYAASAEQNSSTTAAASNDELASSREDVSAAVKQRMDAALLAFKNRDYAAAQRECEQAIELSIVDCNLYEFRALCQFAQGNYRPAAATLYSVLAAGPGWNWNTLSSLYSSAQIYTPQLRRLEQFVRGNPRDAAGHFVLAYHYLVLDARDAALGQLREVVRAQPQDKLSASIVQALEKAKQNRAGASAEKPMPGR
jgi:tetratricopeptide (TPR) repeat protein